MFESHVHKEPSCILLEAAVLTKLILDLQKPTCLCFLRAEIQGVHLQAQPSCMLFFLMIHNTLYNISDLKWILSEDDRKSEHV